MDVSNGSSEFSDAECDDVDEMIVVSGNAQTNQISQLDQE
jgi:hypothetical protein